MRRYLIRLFEKLCIVAVFCSVMYTMGIAISVFLWLIGAFA